MHRECTDRSPDAVLAKTAGAWIDIWKNNRGQLQLYSICKQNPIGFHLRVGFCAASSCFLHTLLHQLTSMNAQQYVLQTLSHDELARVIRRIDSDTLVPLIRAEECPFGHVVHLLISKLVVGRGSGIRFDFESSTVFVGEEPDDFTAAKYLLEECKGLMFEKARVIFKGTHGLFETNSARMARFTDLFGCFLAPGSSISVRLHEQNTVSLCAVENNIRKAITELHLSMISTRHPPNPMDAASFRHLGLNLKVFEYDGYPLSYI